MTGPLFKWFGSKWLSARKLPPPRHAEIVEVFAGGAGYSLRYASHRVTICEVDPHLTLLWCWLIEEATSDTIREIPIGVLEGTDIRTLGLSAGQSLLLKSWQRTNNVGDCWTISPWGNKPGQWTSNTRARVAAEVHEIKHWRFVPDGFAEMQSKREATWFVDPPYEFNYRYRQTGFDHVALGRSVANLRGQVIVCEAEEPKTGRLPTWLPFRSFGSRITSRRKSTEHHHSRELIWEGGL